MSSETTRIESILLFISDYIHNEGTPPTIREIGDHEGVASTSTINYWLLVLENDGYIQRKRGIPRSIRILPPGLERIGLSRVTVR